MSLDLRQGIAEAEALLAAARAEDSEAVWRMLQVFWARGWAQSWDLDEMSWPFVTWSVRCRPFDWAIDA